MYQKIKNKNELASTVRHHSTLDPSLKEFLLFSYHPSSKVLLCYLFHLLLLLPCFPSSKKTMMMMMMMMRFVLS